MASGSHPMDMVPVCPTCLEAYKTDKSYTERLRTRECLDPEVHDHENRPLSVINEMTGMYCVLFIYMSILNHYCKLKCMIWYTCTCMTDFSGRRE